jgi:hypothetical protein
MNGVEKQSWRGWFNLYQARVSSACSMAMG